MTGEQTRQASGEPIEVMGNLPRWIHLLPAGTFKGMDGRGPFHFEDADRVIAASFEEAAGRTIPIDYDHQIDLLPNKGGTAPAAGWIVKMEMRSDGLWAAVDWTPRAAQMIREREYRFISPVFAHGYDNRIRRIARAALTNNPALELVSLNSRQIGASRMPSKTTLAELRKLLGLDDAADEAAIIEAVKKALTQRASFDPSKFVPIEVFQRTAAELNAAHQGTSRQAAEMAVDAAASEGRIFPFMREWALELCMANRPAFERFINNVGSPLGKIAESLTGPSRFAARGLSDGAPHPELDEVHTRLGLSAEDVAKFGKGH